jgi:hypothetical protein
MMAPATNTQPATAKDMRFRLLLLLLSTVPATAVAAAPVVGGAGTGGMGGMDVRLLLS